MEDDKKLMEIPDHDLFIKNFQSVYWAMTAKTDCKSKVFPERVEIRLDDIYTLNDWITEKFKAHYEDAGFTINITVNFYGRDSIEFSSWTTFENYSFKVTNQIQSITIVWEYYAQLPKYQVPQKHVLMVKLSDGLKPEEMINLVFTGKLENMQELDAEISPVVARVDFVNQLLADELLDLVAKWAHGLKNPEAEKKWMIKILQKHKRKIAYLICYVSTFFIGLAGISIIAKYLMHIDINNISQITMECLGDILYIVFIVFSGCFIAYKIVDFLSNVFFNMLIEDNKTEHVFSITNGDEKKQQKIKRRNKNKIFGMVSSIVATILLDILCAIIIKWLKI